MNKSISNPSAARDLELYAVNDGELYAGIIRSTVANMARKMRRGCYDADKAVKAWEYVAEAAAKKYAREFARVGEWCSLFNLATRRETAEALAEYFADNVTEAAAA